MRRAERLFRVIQYLKRAGQPVTAAAIGRHLEVSVRTVYRDIAHLVGSGVPIEGEAGVGYVLRDAYELAPVTFTFEQLEALAFGVRATAALADRDLADSARAALAKIEAALPEAHASRLRDAPLYAFRSDDTPAAPDHLSRLRLAVREKRKARLDYASIAGQQTERTVWPLALIRWSHVWMLAGWCELRGDFRSFRVERIDRLALLKDRYPDQPGRTLADFVARQTGR
ncbi:helix-turn-helix transcriptional regulator [Oceanibacterium hippocampi]|uniref:HTH domain protein n=1 Tax=Oceanibacterium hippocampi TaxID=745714 RepID=A0A1Y5TXF9_9PROT|nr:YafY family protein [Oceanibacterium hippocampi]SLN76136.1 HTH domain protein [Oceanibacterium hippocampi]